MTSILRLRGCPWSATEDDLRGFFEGFDVQACHLCLRNGKPTGEAYVQFGSAEEAAEALKKKNHEHMGSRYIEIFESLEASLVARSLGGQPTLTGQVVRLRGLPFAASAQDVVFFFQGIEVVGGEAGVIFTCTPDGRPTGEAYVEVAGAEGKAEALGRHKEKMGSRYIEIFDSSKGDMYQAVQQHGCFTAVGGKRRHHWAAGGGGGQHGMAQPSGSGGYGDMGPPGRGPRGPGGHSLEEMTNAFAGFGISPHDVQVPGPPRGAFMPFSMPPHSHDDRQYGARPGPQGPMQGMQPHWRPPSQPATGAPLPGGRPQFSRAPGPPGKGANSIGGGRQPGGGGGGLYDYPTSPPLMMQAPFMLQPPPFMHPGQQPGSPWAAAMMASAQQGGGAWYAAGMAPSGRGGVPMGMPGHYTTYGPGYYMRSPGMSPHLGPGGGAGHGGAALGGGHPGYPRGGPPQGGSAGGAMAAAPLPVPLPRQHEGEGGPQRVPTPGSLQGGIGGRGDSSHSLTGLMHAAPGRPDSAPPQPDALQ